MSTFENINSEMYLNIELVNTDFLKDFQSLTINLEWNCKRKLNIFPLIIIIIFFFMFQFYYIQCI